MDYSYWTMQSVINLSFQYIMLEHNWPDMLSIHHVGAQLALNLTELWLVKSNILQTWYPICELYSTMIFALLWLFLVRSYCCKLIKNAIKMCGVLYFFYQCITEWPTSLSNMVLKGSHANTRCRNHIAHILYLTPWALLAF